jgi:hypothetical protein
MSGFGAKELRRAGEEARQHIVDHQRQREVDEKFAAQSAQAFGGATRHIHVSSIDRRNPVFVTGVAAIVGASVLGLGYARTTNPAEQLASNLCGLSGTAAGLFSSQEPCCPTQAVSGSEIVTNEVVLSPTTIILPNKAADGSGVSEAIDYRIHGDPSVGKFKTGNCNFVISVAVGAVAAESYSDTNLSAMSISPEGLEEQLPAGVVNAEHLFMRFNLLHKQAIDAGQTDVAQAISESCMNDVQSWMGSIHENPSVFIADNFSQEILAVNQEPKPIRTSIDFSPYTNVPAPPNGRKWVRFVGENSGEPLACPPPPRPAGVTQ